jgi:PilZ domain
MDQAAAAQNRRSHRSHVLMSATLEAPDASWTVTLRNLSEDGALVSGQDLPGDGTRVLFHRQGLSVPSRVAWSHSNCAGIAFDYPLFPKEMLRHVPPKEKRQLPAIKRRPGLAPQPLTEGERRIIEMWAAESLFALGD